MLQGRLLAGAFECVSRESIQVRLNLSHAMWPVLWASSMLGYSFGQFDFLAFPTDIWLSSVPCSWHLCGQRGFGRHTTQPIMGTSYLFTLNHPCFKLLLELLLRLLSMMQGDLAYKSNKPSPTQVALVKVFGHSKRTYDTTVPFIMRSNLWNLITHVF